MYGSIPIFKLNLIYFHKYKQKMSSIFVFIFAYLTLLQQKYDFVFGMVINVESIICSFWQIHVDRKRFQLTTNFSNDEVFFFSRRKTNNLLYDKYLQIYCMKQTPIILIFFAWLYHFLPYSGWYCSCCVFVWYDAQIIYTLQAFLPFTRILPECDTVCMVRMWLDDVCVMCNVYLWMPKCIGKFWLNGRRLIFIFAKRTHTLRVRADLSQIHLFIFR